MIPSTPLEFWKYFDFVSYGGIFIVLGYLLTAHRRKTGSLLSTISRTVAATKRSSRIFSIAMTICFPLYYAFMWFWVGPLTHMPAGYYWIIGISALCEVTFVWVPATEGRSRTIHEVAASLVGAAMFVLPAIILLDANPITTVSKVAILGFLLVSLAFCAVLMIWRFRKYMLLFETAYCLLFFVAISFVAYS